MILPLDKDRGIKAYYDRVINCQNANSGTAASVNKEGHWLRKLFIRRKGAPRITFDNLSAAIVNNPLLLYVIPYDSYGTVLMDNIASCSFYCRMYYKDP
jgi:hypothetical protein